MVTMSYSPSASSLADIPVAPYPVGSSLATLAPSSSSSELRQELISGASKDSLSMRIPSSENTPSGSVGSLFSQSGPVPHSNVQLLGQSSVPSSGSSSRGHGVEVHQLETSLQDLDEGFAPTRMTQSTSGSSNSPTNVVTKKEKKSRLKYVGKETSNLNDRLELVAEAIRETSSFVNIPKLVTEFEAIPDLDEDQVLDGIDLLSTYKKIANIFFGLNWNHKRLWLLYKLGYGQ
ncbi:hypothetical protein HHK36_020738 [Tetracentron sinense]|uniref:Uncharacterized protein n=1 Tax=Tetracentron sinense TaxID=13715 RepID=A0A835D8M8_TETSI|nr:hypothetical protein HHK36_020738 [Tetracentron sinense]